LRLCDGSDCLLETVGWRRRGVEREEGRVEYVRDEGRERETRRLGSARMVELVIVGDFKWGYGKAVSSWAV
jgi:hypothetical protein